mmetsp:Transcript_5376/g.8580  ORF Transcript_5376/g.8580 Transcript_5376/m.8580 type:complete len:657 (-) Transcript_5376:672-2642(-)
MRFLSAVYITGMVILFSAVASVHYVQYKDFQLSAQISAMHVAESNRKSIQISHDTPQVSLADSADPVIKHQQQVQGGLIDSSSRTEESVGERQQQVTEIVVGFGETKDTNISLQDECFGLQSSGSYAGDWLSMELDLHRFMERDPQRYRLGTALGCLTGKRGEYLEIGVSHGQFTDIMISAGLGKVYLVDPESASFPDFRDRLAKWKSRLPGSVHFHPGFSTDKAFLDSIPDSSLDMIYHDALHTYSALAKDLMLFWKKLKVGGIYAGHDYCVGTPDWQKHSSTWTQMDVRACGIYTKHEKTSKKAYCLSQEPVVKAVHHYAPALGAVHAYTTIENFTQQSAGSMYEKALTKTRNPSWYFVKNGRRSEPVLGSHQLNPRWGRGNLKSDSEVWWGMSCGAQIPWTSASSLRDRSGTSQPRTQPGVTIVLIFRDNQDYLRLQIQHLDQLSVGNAAIELIVVDDFSQHSRPEWVLKPLKTSTIKIRIIRISSKVNWNEVGLFNVGVHRASFDWLILLLDGSVISQAHLKTIQGANSNSIIEFPNSGNQARDAAGALSCSTDTFWGVGGFDEDFAGCHGYVFEHFLSRAKKHPRVEIVRNSSVPLMSSTLCTEASNCQGSQLNFGSKNIVCNQKLLSWKEQTNCWSNSYLRFRWIDVTWP